MKTIKSLILGSAAGLLAVGGAQAADLPVKAKAVEYVKVCSLYGAGFFYIPGTDTCLKIGGFVQYEMEFGQDRGSDIPTYNQNGGLKTRDNDQFYDRARFNINFDTRISTEYGVLRTYINEDLYMNTSNAAYNAALTSNTTNITPAFVFIQFAGFTVGKAVPVTQVPFSEVAGNGYWSAGIFGYSNMTAAQVGQLQAVYTADLGNGLSITAGIADGTYARNGIYDTNLAMGAAFGGASAAGSSATGQYIPDFQGNITLNQAWGGLFLGAEVHELTATYYNLNATSSLAGTSTGTSWLNGHPGDAWGWGVIGGVQIKNIPTGVGDQVYIIGTYGDGLTNVSGSAAPTPTIFALRGYDNPQSISGATNGGVGYGLLVDATYNGFGNGGSQSIQKTKSWGLQGAAEHYWVPGVWRTSVFGGYAAYEYNSVADQQLCIAAMKPMSATGGGQGLSSNSNCNFNVYITQVGTRTSWFPVKNLQLDAEVIWSHFDLPLTGTITAPAVTAFMPSGSYGLTNQNVFTFAARAVRAF